MSSLLYAELAATCNALGYHDGQKYYVDTHCVETIKDLIRYLRRDDENHEIRRHLGEAKVLQMDLIPIFKGYWERSDLFDVVLRLMLNLTNPALLLYREELPADKTSRNFYLQIISHLQMYKEAMSDTAVWAIFSKKLGEILQIEWQERGEETSLVVERILILVRNVLQVPADPDAEKRTDNDASIHDQILWALHQSGMVDIFLYICSMENEHQYYMHILEIVSLMLREQNPVELASAALQRSSLEKQRDESELLAIRLEETQERFTKVRKYAGARHSRFGGTFVLKAMKSISDQDLIYHKPLNNIEDLNFDVEKNKQKRPKNRLPMKSERTERRSAYSVRLFLKEFCVEFLTGAYNNLMHSVKDGLVRAKAQANDESYYLWAMKFFMEFNRNYNFQVQLVSETMHTQTFHFVQTQLENCYEMIVSDKKKLLLWSRRMHLALKAYQELLMTLTAMDKSTDASVRNSSKVIKSNIFYVIEYRELILMLLLNFDEVKMSRAYLKDLMETAHIFLKLLEQFCSRSHLVVQKPAVRRKKKKINKDSNQNPQETLPKRDPEALWDELGPQLSVVLQGHTEISSDVIPFDAVSDKDIDEQKVDAMRNIQTYLQEHKFEEAISLLRASREVWPENDCFGNPYMSAEEEFMSIREIFMADIPHAEGDSPEVMRPTTHDQESEEEEEEEEDGQEAMGTAVSEQDFQFIDFARRLAHSKVVQACAMLLHQFNKNTPYTNHCVIKMLHRIAWDIKMPAMLFQASLFRTFQRILHSRNVQFKELSKLAVFIVRKFTEVAATNKKVFMELLFWKSNKDAYDIEQGYGSYTARTHSSKQVWGEEEEDELRRLYQEFMGKEGGSASGVVDWILENIINKDRSKRGIIKKLKDLGYNVSTKPPPKRPPKQWTETEVQELTQLFHTYKASGDPVGDILVNLTIVRPRSQVVSQLLDLGLIHDKKELRKKRSGKSSGERDPDSSPGESDIDSGASGSDSERGTSPPPNRRPMPNQPKARAKSNKRRHVPKTVTLFSAAQVAALLKDVIEAGMKEALEWVQSTLAEEADDRDDELAEEGVPMLPLTEGTISAMEDATFLRLLTALGLTKPFQEQEMYWRIPPSLLPQDLRSRAEVITHALEGRFAALQDDSTQRRGRRGSESLDSSGDEFSRLKRFVPGSLASDTVSPAGGTTRDRYDVTQRNKTDHSGQQTTSSPNITTNITSTSKHSKSDGADSSVPKSKRRGLNIPVLFDSDTESDEDEREDESQRNLDQIASTSKTAESSSNVSTSKNKMSLKKPTPLDSDSELSEATSSQGMEASKGRPNHSIDLLWDSLLSGKSSLAKMANSDGAKTPSSTASIKPKRHRIIKTPVLDSDSDEEFPDISRTFDQNKKDTVAADYSPRTQSEKDVLKSILDSSDSDSESNRSGGKLGNSLWDESNGEMTRRAAHKRILDSDSEDEIKNTKKLHPIHDDD